MPIDEVAGAVGGILVEGATELVGDKVQRRFGWKGCLALTVFVAAVIGLIVYLV